MKRPTREQLGGYSLSEFKVFLKHLGHKVPRNLTYAGYITQCGYHYYRWRWWSDEGFVVDRSVPVWDFDRWGNSVEETCPFESLDPFLYSFLQRLSPERRVSDERTN